MFSRSRSAKGITKDRNLWEAQNLIWDPLREEPFRVSWHGPIHETRLTKFCFHDEGSGPWSCISETCIVLDSIQLTAHTCGQGDSPYNWVHYIQFCSSCHGTLDHRTLWPHELLVRTKLMHEIYESLLAYHKPSISYHHQHHHHSHVNLIYKRDRNTWEQTREIIPGLSTSFA